MKKHHQQQKNKFSLINLIAIPLLLFALFFLKFLTLIHFTFVKSYRSLVISPISLLVKFRLLKKTGKQKSQVKKKKKIKTNKIIFRNKFAAITPLISLGNRILRKIRRLKFRLELVIIPKFTSQVKLFLFKSKYFIFGAFFVAVFVSLYNVFTLIANLPHPAYLTKRDIQTTTKLYDRNGIFLFEIYGNENRTPVKFEDIPQVVIQATIATEDKEFYLHQGISLRGIIRAIIHNLNSQILEGGSTITQQLIRSAFLTTQKTYTRKLKEIFLSIWAEYLYSKNEILEMYLNQVSYGGTAWGIESASQMYLGKSIKDTNLAEAAFLVGLPAAPTTYSPYGENPQLYKTRQADVLRQMRENGFITKDDEEKAKNEKVDIKPQRTPILAPHFVMYVKEQLENIYGKRLVTNGGLRVTTSIDLNLNETVSDIVIKQIDSLRKLNVTNGASLITNPQTGEILAMIGSVDYFDTEHQGNVNVTRSLRPPGSSIKIVTYAAALENGYTSSTLLDDTPVSFTNDIGFPYTPVNYDGTFHGTTTLRTAFGSSYNIPAVKVLSKIGVKSMIEQGRFMGITTWNDESRFGLSLTLGGGEVTMLDMAKVYATVANGGIRRELQTILKVTDYKGNQLPLPNKNKKTKALSPQTAFNLSSILSDNDARTPAFGPNSSLVIPGKTVAVKTGTSDNKKDNWTIGFTPDYVVVVWVGNNDNSPMHPSLTSGVTGAAPIWQEIMISLLKGKKDKPFIFP